MENKGTKEPQYNVCIDYKNKFGLQSFGLMSSYIWTTDPKRMAFVFSRYKFIAKMFAGLDRVVEIGCGDAVGSRIVAQDVTSLTAVDFDPVFIGDAKSRSAEPFKIEYMVHDILDSPVPGGFDGAYSLDVIEHIPAEKEDLLMRNVVQSLNPGGAAIIGTPSLESQAHASPPSKEGHINCKTAAQLKELALKFFHNVFIFSMNDEVVHTGFYPMAHYLFALCCNPKDNT